VAVYAGVAAVAARAPLWGGRVWWVALGGGAAVLAVALAVAPRTAARSGLSAVVLGAALFRLVLLPLPPQPLTNDPYRYLWDGRVAAAGINPYAYPPNDPALAALRDEALFPNLRRRPATTIYPPGAQAVFAAAWRAGLRTVVGFKLLVVAADLVAVGLLVRFLAATGRDPRAAVAYAWNPLPILSFGQSGHVDALVVLCLAAAVLGWRRGGIVATGVLLGMAGTLKLYPLALLPAFWRPPHGRWSWRWTGTVTALACALPAAAYLPYALDIGGRVLGYLSGGYLIEEGYASGARFVLPASLGLDGRLLAPLLLAGVGAAVVGSRSAAPRRAAWLLGAALALTTPYPWYAAALVALAVAGGAGWAWPWFGVALEAAHVAARVGPFGLVRPIMVVTAAAMALLAGAAVGWPPARHAVVAQEPG
jgi:hypothetical protein